MILGIDLGTSNSLAAVFCDGEVVIVKNKAGSPVFPSVISADSEGNIYTGDVALHRKKQFNDSSVSMFKRNIGTNNKFYLGDISCSAEELSSILLKAIRNQAEEFFGEEITEAVISVPAFFNNFQRKSVINAGKIAGFDVKRIINEPTAAAMAYGVQNTDEDRKVIIVLDLGGGTFDISVMEVNGSVMEVVAVCGDNKLGGGDFTKRLIKLFKEHNSIEGELGKEEKAALWNEAEKAKHQITAEGKASMKCSIGGVEYEFAITEAEYEENCMDLLETIRKLTLKAIEESKYEPYEIKDILMVGGGTKLSIVKKMMEKMIGREIDYKLNPDEAVVRGTALQGALLNHDENVSEIVMTDICSHNIGCRSFFVDQYDRANAYDIIVKKNTTIPVKRTIKHYSWHSTWVLEVLQCENELGIGAVTLDKFDYITPYLNSDKRVEVQKSIIIDSDGIIYAEVYIPANGMRYSKMVQSDGTELSQEELDRRINELNSLHLELHGRENDVLLMARADRIYAEAGGKHRDTIGECIVRYETAVNEGKVTLIEQTKTDLIQLLNSYENGIGGF